MEFGGYTNYQTEDVLFGIQFAILFSLLHG